MGDHQMLLDQLLHLLNIYPSVMDQMVLLVMTVCFLDTIQESLMEHHTHLMVALDKQDSIHISKIFNLHQCVDNHILIKIITLIIIKESEFSNEKRFIYGKI